MAKGKEKLLTVKFDLDTLAEFGAAVEVLKWRSVSANIHQHVSLTIEQARKRAESPEEFDRLVASKRKEIMQRSRLKAKQRQNPKNPNGVPVLPPEPLGTFDDVDKIEAEQQTKRRHK